MSALPRSNGFVFVLMPFASDFNDTYEFGIRSACQEEGFYCERVDEQVFEGTILTRIYNQIQKADLVIADMSTRNPNVFYETGYAHALGKPVILLTNATADIPFDLKHYPHIVYEGRIIKLKSELTRRLRWHAEHQQYAEDWSGFLELYSQGESISETGTLHAHWLQPRALIDFPPLPSFPRLSSVGGDEEQESAEGSVDDGLAELLVARIDLFNSGPVTIASISDIVLILKKEIYKDARTMVAERRKNILEMPGHLLMLRSGDVFEFELDFSSLVIHPQQWKSIDFNLGKRQYLISQLAGTESASVRVFHARGIRELDVRIEIEAEPRKKGVAY